MVEYLKISKKVKFVYARTSSIEGLGNPIMYKYNSHFNGTKQNFHCHDKQVEN